MWLMFNGNFQGTEDENVSVKQQRKLLCKLIHYGFKKGGEWMGPWGKDEAPANDAHHNLQPTQAH